MDVTVGMACGVRVHRRMDCSTVFGYDGFAALMQKPKPLPMWLGPILPFDKYSWLAILGVLILATLIMGFCMKFVVKFKRVDWTIHFLDALHPMCGRNMALPGLNASHLGRK